MHNESNATPTQRKAKHTGIEERHARSCRSRSGGRCSCKPTYQATVHSHREGRRIRKTFPTVSAAKSWRADAVVGIRKGTLRAPTRATVVESADALVRGMEDSTIRTRGGKPYKPSVIRSYRIAVENYINDYFGGTRLSDVTRANVQDFADRLSSEHGLSASSVHNKVMPLRVIFRRALHRGDVAVNPTLGLELPAPDGKRDRTATPAEAEELLAVLPAEDRALWATAFFAGLRRGELRGLRWEDVDLDAAEIRVERSYDDREGIIEPKSEKGKRTTPIPETLRAYLREHARLTGRTTGYVFGSTVSNPFTPSNKRTRARRAWEAENERRIAEAEERGEDAPELLVPIGLHECRHTYVTLMHSSKVPLERIGDYVGHSSTYMTDRYRHLLEGQRAKDAAALDAFLAGADTASRIAQLTPSPVERDAIDELEALPVMDEDERAAA